jgi:DNA-binding NarL/FixJ family response regulator
MTPPTASRVAVVDDHSLFAEAMDIALSIEGYDTRRFVPDPAQGVPGRLVREIARARPGVVLLDLDLGVGGDGLRLIQPLALLGINVVVVTGSGDRARWGECVSHGARKVIPKSAPLNEILATIGRLNNGLPVMSRDEGEELLAFWRRQMEAEKEICFRLDQLTRREAETLGQLMDGKQVGEIARARFVSESTVRTQVKSVLAKLQVGSQLTAVGLAHRARWQPPQDLEETGDATRGTVVVEAPAKPVRLIHQR